MLRESTMEDQTNKYSKYDWYEAQSLPPRSEYHQKKKKKRNEKKRNEKNIHLILTKVLFVLFLTFTTAVFIYYLTF